MLEATMEQEYRLWRKSATEDADLVRELEAIEGDEEAIRDRFYDCLHFGTAGLRGVLGAGSNRMNIYTVRQATQGLADYLNREGTPASVAISFDSRHKSSLFAREAARVLAANGITVHLMTELQPVPVLSFATRELHCSAGIMITASHNPAKYNGYKCYGPDGCQMTDEAADAVTQCIESIPLFGGAKVADYEAAVAEKRIVPVELSFVERFLDRIGTRCVNPGLCREVPLSVIYSPLNGAGNKPVRAILGRIGVSHLTVVPEQELPDGDFPTAPYPNPEIRDSFTCALKLAETVHPDLLLATDPDCDRVGIAVRDGDGYTLMTGNEVGCLLLNYILSCRKANGTLPEHPVAVTTIVSSRLASAIARKYGCEMRLVLTGFKYIGEQIGLLEKAGEAERFVFGFEESYGYLAGSYVRDKDAVVASMLICEMAAYYKKQGKTLLAVLQELYREHGVYVHRVLNVGFEGEQGMKAMTALMEHLRELPPQELAGRPVLARTDYLRSEEVDCRTGAVTRVTLPQSNVLSYDLGEGAGLIVRPSGTEPKIKAYMTATGQSAEAAAQLADRLRETAEQLLKHEA